MARGVEMQLSRVFAEVALRQVRFRVISLDPIQTKTRLIQAYQGKEATKYWLPAEPAAVAYGGLRGMYALAAEPPKLLYRLQIYTRVLYINSRKVSCFFPLDKAPAYSIKSLFYVRM